jgi:uncharacterized protein YggE
LSGSVLPPIRTIEVEGNGEVSAKPDTASLSVAVETHAETAEKSAKLNASLADKITAALRSKLGEAGKIQTGGYSLNPDYQQRQGYENGKITGYRTENSVSVETTDLALAGPLIDAAIGAGANRINYLNFTLKDDVKARADAIASASRDAQANATALAVSLGVKLKRIYSATTAAQARPMPVAFQGRAMAAMASAPTPIEPGELTIPAHVSLTYEIE